MEREKDHVLETNCKLINFPKYQMLGQSVSSFFHFQDSQFCFHYQEPLFCFLFTLPHLEEKELDKLSTQIHNIEQQK